MSVCAFKSVCVCVGGGGVRACVRVCVCVRGRARVLFSASAFIILGIIYL